MYYLFISLVVLSTANQAAKQEDPHVKEFLEEVGEKIEG